MSCCCQVCCYGQFPPYNTSWREKIWWEWQCKLCRHSIFTDLQNSQISFACVKIFPLHTHTHARTIIIVNLNPILTLTLKPTINPQTGQKSAWTWQKQPTIALKQVTTDQLCWKCTQSLCKFPALQFYSWITQNTLVLLVVLSSAIISKDMLSFLIRSHFSCPRETPQFEPTDITSEAERLLLLCSTSIFPADPQHPIYFIVISINKNTPEGLKTNK